MPKKENDRNIDEIKKQEKRTSKIIIFISIGIGILAAIVIMSLMEFLK